MKISNTHKVLYAGLVAGVLVNVVITIASYTNMPRQELWPFIFLGSVLGAGLLTGHVLKRYIRYGYAIGLLGSLYGYATSIMLGFAIFALGPIGYLLVLPVCCAAAYWVLHWYFAKSQWRYRYKVLFASAGLVAWYLVASVLGLYFVRLYVAML